jgi:hypothetical protein
MGINPFFVPEPTPVLTDSVMMLDATSATSYPGTGNTWTDLSGNGNNADVSLVTSYWNAGGYFDWPGTDYTKIATVSHAASLNIFNADYTVLMVGTIDATAGGFSDLAGMWSKPDFNANPSTGQLFIRNSADGNFRKMQYYINGTGIGLSSGTAFASIGDWFVIHVTRSGNTYTYYDVNNNSFGTATSSLNGNSTGTLQIGRARNDATANYKWDGKVAGIGLYTGVLTSDERLQNINYFKDKLGF